MEPGSPGFNAPDLTVTRFTVPTAGTFDIAGSFTDLQQASVALLIVIDGKTVFSSSFSGQSPYQGTIPFSIAGITLQAGQTIDFVVDSLGDQAFDVVVLKALITETLTVTTIEAFGSTSLVQVGNNYFLYPAGGSSDPLLKYADGTRPVVAGQTGNWLPIGAEQTASGYEVAWKNSLAPTSIPCGILTRTAPTSPAPSASYRDRAWRCRHSSPASSKT
jgi:hypothetical protein